ncbi:hypothetical protein FHR83_005230 [Actinoplanes campanulatus]|uniref:SurA N-terminal domain-containing protein n=1 Tax=Actinoplanes campanulatus TaxID=113559 RepID=A0A7W5AK24_9ACTN|nr:hypothetical protein [Actinoplanes campanulatus]MBB3097552.1 hypothetical protein [Actinoplanes campanulatus]GGN27555.1 hypothetical protein GCM10010109_45220 [Actinoplanes campanulatus]GID37985.1 hypothetical protein Aca09nite_44910 [Actinoplanes campanulatus]
MLRARRLASTVVAASLAVGGLSACDSEPSVAAYLGDAGQVSEQEVQRIWDDTHADLAAQAQAEADEATRQQRFKEEALRNAGQDVKTAPAVTPAPVQMPFSRGDIVNELVTRELYEQVAADRSVTLPAQVPYEEEAAQRKLPAGTEYSKLYIDNLYMQSLLIQSFLSETPPADADMLQVYNSLGANGGVEPGQDFTTWLSLQSPQNRQVVAAAAQVREQVEGAADELNVEVNPRYQPFEVSVLEIQGESDPLQLLGTDLGVEQSVPVADVS